LNQLSVKYREAFGEKEWASGMEIKELWRSPLPRLPEPQVPVLTFGEFEARLAQYVNRVEGEEQAYVWAHVRSRIEEINRRGGDKIARVRGAMMELELSLDPNVGEQFGHNRWEPKEINHWLDEVVFEV
jgi:hypothetical protein